MSLVIKIDVAGNAVPGVKQVTTELGKSAAAMQAAGAEMMKFGDKSSAAGKRAADAFKAAKKEVDALAKEKGPGLGAGLGVVMGAAAALGIDAAIGKVEGLIDGYFRLRDVYIEASNSAIKFADATHTVDQVLREQIQLAHDLHSNYKTTIELYDSVRDGTDELNVSHGEQIRLLRSLSETAMLSGKSLESVGGMMSKFSYALASGRIEQRSLRAMMTEMPELANVWIAKFGGSRDAVLRMMKDGRIGTEDLMMALIEQSKAVDVLDTNYKKITNTEAKMKESFEANVKLFRSQGDTSNASVTQRAIEMFRGQGDTFSDPIVKAQQAAAGLGKTWADLATAMIDKAGDVSAAWERAHQELNSSQKAMLASIRDPIEAGKVAIDNLNKLFSLGKVSIDEYDKAYSGLVAQVGNSKEVLRLAIEGPIEAAKKGLADLKEIVAEGGGNAVDNWKKQKEFLTALNHGELPETIKLWEALRAPQKAFSEGTRALDYLLDHGRTTTERYNFELKKLIETFSGGELAKLLDFSAKPFKPESLANDFAEHQANVAHESLIGDKMSDIDKQYQQPEGPDLGQDMAAFDRRADLIDKLTGSTKEYRQQMTDVNDLMKSGDLDARQYAEAVDGIRAAELAATDAGKTFAGGMEAAWLKMKLDAESFGATVANTLVGDLDKLNDAIVTAANGGEVAWGNMVDSMIQDLERLLLKQLEIMAITALLNAVLPGLGSAASSSGATGAGVNYASTASSAITTPGAYPTSMPGGGGASNIGTISRSGGGGTPTAAAPVIVQVHNHYDRQIGIAAIASPAGATAILNVQRANGGAFRNAKR